MQSNVFTCPKCRKQWPMSESVSKGNQLWCSKDSATYTALMGRCQKNAKLKRWWTNLGDDDRVAYYLKWQGMNSRQRFQDMNYCESATDAMEDIEDEIDDYNTFAKFCRELLTPRASLSWRRTGRTWSTRIRANASSGVASGSSPSSLACR